MAFSMAKVDLSRRSVQLANAGCPYPCHYRKATGDAIEVALDAYPLGVRPDTIYRTTDVQLGPGDYIVLYSDGFAEAVNASEDLFGFTRTLDTIRQACSQGLTPEAVIDYLVTAVRVFTGDVAQGDDMTCVVVKVEG